MNNGNGISTDFDRFITNEYYVFVEPLSYNGLTLHPMSVEIFDPLRGRNYCYVNELSTANFNWLKRFRIETDRWWGEYLTESNDAHEFYSSVYDEFDLHHDYMVDSEFVHALLYRSDVVLADIVEQHLKPELVERAYNCNVVATMPLYSHEVTNYAFLDQHYDSRTYENIPRLQNELTYIRRRLFNIRNLVGGTVEWEQLAQLFNR